MRLPCSRKPLFGLTAAFWVCALACASNEASAADRLIGLHSAQVMS